MKNKFLLIFSAIMSLSLIYSSTSNFTYYRNLGIKAITYPFNQFWNSSRSTKVLVVIGSISALLLLKKKRTLKKSFKYLISFNYLISFKYLIENEIEKKINSITSEIDEIGKLDQDISKNKVQSEQINVINRLYSELRNVHRQKHEIANNIWSRLELSHIHKMELFTKLSTSQREINQQFDRLDRLKNELLKLNKNQI